MPHSATAVVPDEPVVSHRRPSPFFLVAWKQFVNVAKPYWLGDQKKVAWTLVAPLIVLKKRMESDRP
nr:hypothetical protein [Rhodoferax sp.]